MAFWLFKQEPDEYSYTDLERDGRTTWTGVRNPVAQKHLRATREGDEAFFYHTGKEKAVVGILTVVGPPEPSADDVKMVVVTVAPVRRLPSPVTLAVLKADPELAEWELVRLPRLSVMPVPPAIWKTVLKYAAGK
jgi:predicted RNA-binding protein with PUA-like domain